MATINAINDKSSPFTISTGNLVVSAGTLSTAAGSITSATTMTATNGTIAITSGDLVLTSGNISLPTTSSASIGNITINNVNLFHTYGTNNIFIGPESGNDSLVNAIGNTCVGIYTGEYLDGSSAGKGCYNSALGYGALFSTADGSRNCSCGSNSGTALDSGDDNVFLGRTAAYNSITTGSQNTIIGHGSASAYTGSESNNLLIGFNIAGTNGESNVIRLGDVTGTGNGEINYPYIYGIYSNSTTGTTVRLSTTANSGKIGTTTSTRASKYDIADIGEASSVIYDLRPRTFEYIADPDPKPKNFGLIAEEVYPVLPNIVGLLNDAPCTVQLPDLNPLLVNELQKLKSRVTALQALLEL